MHHRLTSLTLFVLASILLGGSAHAAKLEVLHWWTSGSEAKAVGELKKMLEAKGHTWKDFAVAGGGGENAMTVLKARVVSGNPPAAAQIKGPLIQEWASMGVVADLTAVAKAQRWDERLPKRLANQMKYKGKYVATPVNVHRVNWLWANPALFKQIGAKVPKTWDEAFAVCETFKAKGIIPFAHGGQAWQDATVFEAIVLAHGGSAFYQKALVDLDPSALKDPRMVESFDMFRKYQACTDKDRSGRDWNLATAMVINGKAAMQIMGDWAKGEFLSAGKTPGKDFVCQPAPGTTSSFTYNVDSFVMFAQKGDAQKAQNALATAILDPKFQKLFNTRKGSIPVRKDMEMSTFDLCAKDSMKAFVQAEKKDTLMPSMAHGMAVSSAAQGAIFDAVTQFFNSSQSSKKAVVAMQNAVAASKF